MRSRITLMLLLLMAAGCATVEGAGEDIQTAGEAVSGAARDAQGDM
ncbi:MAG: entericidin A/B family lipoprotein [Rhodobacteraceae bacterium]|nr:entericidin A/B family lipoprotein [Paracoccaceae bacterium]